MTLRKNMSQPSQLSQCQQRQGFVPGQSLLWGCPERKTVPQDASLGLWDGGTVLSENFLFVPYPRTLGTQEIGTVGTLGTVRINVGKKEK